MKNRVNRKLLKSILLYLIDRLNHYGYEINRKKIMKLMFLIDHYDTKSKKLKPKSLTGAKWFIYHY